MSGAYKDKITGIYMILNEFLTCAYYLIISLPYISNLNLTTKEISSHCIKIVLSALGLNVLLSFIMTGLRIKTFIQKCVDKRRNKVIPVASSTLKAITGVSSNLNLDSDNLEEYPNVNTGDNLFSQSKFNFSKGKSNY